MPRPDVEGAHGSRYSSPSTIPDNANVIIGQSHFIKTVEDLYEIMVTSVPQAAFGLAFNEASGPCLIRVDGNDDGAARGRHRRGQAIGAGHTFVLFLRNAYPINVLNRIKDCPEVCRIFCATANPAAGGRGASLNRAAASSASSTGRRRRASSRTPTASGASGS